jgi:NAD(P)-dependent dehydrogenase (short-subunit alcohol dehydrogenase family)
MNKTLLITGASRGIGAASARLAAQRGYAVCVNYLSNRSAADAVVEDITRAGVRAVAIQADVSVEEDVISLYKAVDRSLGPVTAQQRRHR